MAQLYWPFDPSVITEGYGWAEWRQAVHDGIDFGVPQGTPLRATAAGVIRNVDAGVQGGAGVDITTPDGWKVRHWHVSKFMLPNGTTVNVGDIIALSGGAKGTWGAGFSTGAHLHWGVNTGKAWVDPKTLNPISFDEAKSKDTEEMYVIRNVDTGHVYTVGKQYIRHEPWMPGAEYVARVVSADDKIIQSSDNEFLSVLDSFAIPRDKALAVVGGKYWSREKDILDAIIGKK